MRKLKGGLLCLALCTLLMGCSEDVQQPISDTPEPQQQQAKKQIQHNDPPPIVGQVKYMTNEEFREFVEAHESEIMRYPSGAIGWKRWRAERETSSIWRCEYR